MAKDVQIAMRMTSEMRNALQEAAKADRRSMGSYIEGLLVADLKMKGILIQATQTPQIGSKKR